MKPPSAVALIVGVSLALAGCPEPHWAWEGEAHDAGLRIESDRALSRVELLDGEGHTIAVRRLPRPLHELDWAIPLEPEEDYRLVVRSSLGTREISLRGPPRPPDFVVTVEAPLGQQHHQPSDGEVLSFGVVEGLGTQVGLRLRALRAGAAIVEICGERHELEARAPGELLVVAATLPPDLDCPVRVRSQEEDRRFVLHPNVSRLSDVREALRIDRVVFPADGRGEPDPGRTEGRVTLPSPRLEQLLRTRWLGVRARALEAPWGYQAVHVRNEGDKAINVVLRVAVLDAQGHPSLAFRSRLRRFDTGRGGVTALLRVPPHSTEVAALPLFVDPGPLPSGAGEWIREVELTPLGSEAALLVERSPLYVKRGSSWTAVGFAVVVVSMLLGLALLLLRLGPWIRRSTTSELVTIALFANLMFFFSAAAHVVGLGAASLLGPFSTLLTGLLDDVFRYTLLATLVTLLPRPGVLTIAVLLHTVMRTLALGGFHPGLPFILGSTVLWMELFLWLSGITRGGGAWRDDPPGRRWLRLSLAFAPPAVINGAVGLLTAAVLYRLYYADWYVVLMLGLPGFLYTVLACRLAVNFAESLRRVEA